jgi:hypothetical protein
MLRLMADLCHPGDIFSYHVEFQVDPGTGDHRLDIGVVESIGDDSDIEFCFFDIKNGQAGAIEADGAFFNHQAAEFFGEFKSEFPTAVEVMALETNGSGVDVSLDDVSVEAAIHDHASFQVDEVASLPVAEICFFKCLFDGCDAVEVILYFFNGKTGAIVGNALVYLERGDERGFNPKCLVGAVNLNGVYFSERFDNSGKHGGKFRNFF